MWSGAAVEDYRVNKNLLAAGSNRVTKPTGGRPVKATWKKAPGKAEARWKPRYKFIMPKVVTTATCVSVEGTGERHDFHF